ncbi:DUF1963 domain-containing protein [Sphingopyxis sp.]|uniref:DUF1963 domain-containing protein n=1 Tax=Sphingopyxis sp. TaxID=1908224 RepID=UPI003D0BCDF8
MSDLNRAALTLAGLTAVFLFLVYMAWRARRRQPEPAAPRAPKAPRLPGESRLPKLSRRAEPAFEPAEIAPSRLARISKAVVEQPLEPAEAYEPEPVAAPVLSKLAPEIAVAPADEAADSWADEPEVAPVPSPSSLEPAAPAMDEAILDALATRVEQQAHENTAATMSAPQTASGGIRLAPQIPPRDAIFRKSWMGGRPRLPDVTEWPQIDGRDGDFIAQIACADLPPMLWDGLGPRTGSLAFFANPDNGEATALHLATDGPPRDAPRPVGPAYFRPRGLDSTPLAPLAIPGFPEWAVDVVADASASRNAAEADAILSADYDIGDPAFHPFDWPSMLAMARILEARVLTQPTDGTPPDDANDELVEAIADAAEANRDAAQRTAEIIAIIRESAAADTGFSPTDATAVMAALHAIRWTQVTARPDPESGVDEVETLALPLTRHRPDGDLWVDAWRDLLFDHARHAWCANSASLSAPACAFFEPLWQAMGGDGLASMGNFPSHHAPGFDEERDVVLLELPPSDLLGLAHRGGGHVVFAIRKSDLAMGDFSKIRALAGN